MQAGDEFEVLWRNSLGDEMTMATPAIARGSLFLRDRVEAVPHRVGQPRLTPARSSLRHEG